VPSVLGPLSSSITGIKLFLRTVMDAKPWTLDPQVINKGWDEDAYQLDERGGRDGRLCFGILWDDGQVRPHPPVLRGLRMVKEALVAAGHHGGRS
jgi:amidase